MRKNAKPKAVFDWDFLGKREFLQGFVDTVTRKVAYHANGSAKKPTKTHSKVQESSKSMAKHPQTREKGKNSPVGAFFLPMRYFF